MIRATEVKPHHRWTDPPADTVVLDFDDRHRRRMAMTGTRGLEFLLDLEQATALRSGDALLLCYAIWESPEDDAANSAWHTATIAALDQYAVGHYVGESDIVTSPDRAARSYSQANWERLKRLRRQYDSEGLFHGHFRSA